jgi:hypothetical protein
MELSLFWKAASRSATQEFPKRSMEPECSSTFTKEPYPEPDQSSSYDPNLSL